MLLVVYVHKDSQENRFFREMVFNTHFPITTKTQRAPAVAMHTSSHVLAPILFCCRAVCIPAFWVKGQALRTCSDALHDCITKTAHFIASRACAG